MNRATTNPQPVTSHRRLVVILIAVMVGVFAVFYYWNRSADSVAPRPSTVAAPSQPADLSAPGPQDTPRGAPGGAFPNTPLALTGTSWRKNRAVALISIDNRPADAYAVGQELAGGIAVRSIYPDHVVLGYGDATKTLYVTGIPVRRTNNNTTSSSTPDTGALIETWQENNPNIDPQALTLKRFAAVKDFLSEVKIAPDARGGFVVERVTPDSPYEKLGLRPGDVIYSLDTPGNIDVDETSMESAMAQREMQIEVYRGGNVELLHRRIDQD